MRTAPPRGYLSLANPLAQGLSSAVTFDEQTGIDLYDRVTRKIWRHQGAGTSGWDGSAGGNGYGFLTAINSNWFTYQGNPEDDFLALTNVSVVVVQKKLDTTNRASAPFGTFGGVASRCSAHMPFSDGNVYWDFGGTGAPNRLSVSSTGLDLRQDNVWVFTAGAHGSEIWFNGHRLASQATAIVRSGQVTTYTINAAQGVNGDLAVYSAFYVYQRVLQESEIKRLAIDPYAPFRPVEQLFTLDGPVTVNTEAARVRLRSGATSLALGATSIDTQAARLRVRSAVTTVDAGGATINTDAARLRIRAAETTVDITTAVNTEAARLRLRSATTTITLGQVVVDTTAGHVRLRSADTSVEIGAATIDTLAARIHTRAAITTIFTGARFIPEITCETLALGAVCGVTSLSVECETP